MKLQAYLLHYLFAGVFAGLDYDAGGSLTGSSIIQADGSLFNEAVSTDLSLENLFEETYVTTSEASYKVTAPLSMQHDIASGADLGEPQVLGDENAGDIIAVIEAARVYIQDTVAVDPKLVKIKDLCRNQHTQCAFWASVGECEVCYYILKKDRDTTNGSSGRSTISHTNSSFDHLRTTLDT